jgi:hypothetical protein
MNHEVERMISELDVERVTKHIEWFTYETPSRISGKGQDRKAAEYITRELNNYGMDAGIYEFETYNSLPGEGFLSLIEPCQESISCKAAAHSGDTPDEGINAELIYIGAGGENDFCNKDVKGKILLAEVSYDPATPEKERLAWINGAAGLVLANWGSPGNNAICMQALKGVWGNPTPRTFSQIPELPSVSISRASGDRLIELCRRGEVIVKMSVSSPRSWMVLAQPYGMLQSERSSQFLLVNGHLDAWEPGVTCNATGDAAMLELARVLAKHRKHLARGVYFIFWNGHEIAEAAGSTWYVDTFWPQLTENCPVYMNIDGPGIRGTSVLDIRVARELENWVKKFAAEELKEHANISYPRKTADHSIFGIGIPPLLSRHNFSKEDLQKIGGAFLGWWNHTTEDDLDKYDPTVMAKDIRVQMALIGTLAVESLLPFDFAPVVLDIKNKLSYLAKESAKVSHIIDLNPVLEKAYQLEDLIKELNSKIQKGNSELIQTSNKVLMRLSRILTNAFYTGCDRYSQDSYDAEIFNKPIPILFPIIQLAAKNPEERDFKLMMTEILRARNRLWDALDSAVYVLTDALRFLANV